MHAINLNATSNYNANFLIYNSPFQIHDSPSYSVPLPWHIIQKQRRRLPINNVEVETILCITPKRVKKRKSRRHIYQPIPTNYLPPITGLYYFLVNSALSRINGYLSYINLLYNSYLIFVPHFCR